LGHVYCRNKHIIQHNGIENLEDCSTTRGSKKGKKWIRQKNWKGKNNKWDKHPQSFVFKCNSEKDFPFTPISSFQHFIQINQYTTLGGLDFLANTTLFINVYAI